MSQETTSYRFIATSQGPNSTGSATARELRRAVRSHAARVSRPDHSTWWRNRTQRQNNPSRGITVFDAGLTTTPTAKERKTLLPIGSAISNSDCTLTSTYGCSCFRQHSLDLSNPLRTSLSGETLSPISHLATYHKPYVPGIIHHYIHNLTIPIPELDGSSTVPLFRAAWLPVVVHDPFIFQIIVLFAATHYATYADPGQYDSLHLELLSLKQSALSALVETVQSEPSAASSTSAHGGEVGDHSFSDTLIAAAAKMASYEAIFGAVEAFHLHMSTVARLLRTRDSLSTLGMHGFLARLLSFIDTNSAFLLGTNLYLREFDLIPYPQPCSPTRFGQAESQASRHTTNSEIINLERFIGLIGGVSQS